MPSATLLQSIDGPERELRHLDQRTQDRLRDLGATVAPVQALKRTGARPYLFNGATVATVCGVTPLLPFWYELNVHRTVIGTYVTDIRLFHKSPDLSDLFWIAEHDDLDDAITHLERYDPAGDVLPSQEIAARAGSAAELALWTARLQLQVDAITQHYRALVGELLHVVTPKG
jgi:hypothetical protein